MRKCSPLEASSTRPRLNNITLHHTRPVRAERGCAVSDQYSRAYTDPAPPTTQSKIRKKALRLSRRRCSGSPPTRNPLRHSQPAPSVSTETAATNAAVTPTSVAASHKRGATRPARMPRNIPAAATTNKAAMFMVTYGKRCSSATLRLSAAWNGKVHVSEFDVAGAANYFAPLVLSLIHI